MRPVGVSRQVVRLGPAVAGLATAAAFYFWPIVGTSPTRAITSDLAAYTYPWRRYVTQELFAGRLPHWTPYAGFGFPLLADIEATVLYPVSLISSLVSWGELSYRAVELEDVLHYVVAGLGMFLFLGRTGLGWAAAMVWATDAVLVEAPTRCPSRTGTAPGSVLFEVDHPDRVVLRVRAAEAGPLVLSDTYYRGWTATVNGRRARILRANLPFRMVCVPAGEHVVEFTFRQPKFYLGLGITVATAIGALLIALRPVTRDRAARPH